MREGRAHAARHRIAISESGDHRVVAAEGFIVGCSFGKAVDGLVPGHSRVGTYVDKGDGLAAALLEKVAGGFARAPCENFA